MNRALLEEARDDLLRWHELAPAVGITKYDQTVWQEQISCGTAACAGGFLASLLKNNERGLTFLRPNTISFLPSASVDFQALEDFFDLSPHHVQFIFAFYHKGDARDAAERIQEVLNSHE